MRRTRQYPRSNTDWCIVLCVMTDLTHTYKEPDP